MSNRAFDNRANKIVHSAHFSRNEWKQLQDDHKERWNDETPLLTCGHKKDDGTVCGQRLIPKRRSDTGTQFFSHHRKSDKCRSQRDRIHDDMEYLFQKTLSDIGIRCKLEERLPYLKTHRRPDILFEVSGKLISIEIQISRQDFETYVSRTNEYRWAGIHKTVWICLVSKLFRSKRVNWYSIQDQFQMIPGRQKLERLVKKQLMEQSDEIFIEGKPIKQFLEEQIESERIHVKEEQYSLF